MSRFSFHTKRLAIVATLTTLLVSESAMAASSWKPTLLVNTESFQTIDEGDGTTNIQIKFGQTLQEALTFDRTKNRFQFSKGLSVLGTLSGSALNIDHNATIGGSLTATGSIRTKGNLSGSTLTVDGNLTLHGVTYSAPAAQGGANTFLKNDGAGNLTWSTTSAGNGSGNLISLHPEYNGAVYFASGSTFVGQLTASGGTSALDNSYEWTSSKAAIQDYWISIRVRLPDNFFAWNGVKPIEFRYKTGDASAANNHLTVRMKDTAGANVPLTGGSALANQAWTTAIITGPQSSGTWTPKGYFTIYIKLASNSTAGANAAAGFLNLNFGTTTP